MQRMTRQLPNKIGYYVPLDMGGGFKECRITCAPHAGTSIFGDPIDQLGKYEDLGYSPKELREIIAVAASRNLLPKCEQ